MKKSTKKDNRPLREMQKFEYTDTYGNVDVLIVDEFEFNKFKVVLFGKKSRIPMALSNVMFASRLRSGYEGERDAFKAAVLGAYKSGSDVLQAIMDVTRLDRRYWKAVK